MKRPFLLILPILTPNSIGMIMNKVCIVLHMEKVNTIKNKYFLTLCGKLNLMTVIII